VLDWVYPCSKIIIPGLVPGTYDLAAAWVFMGGRDKPGHDETRNENDSLKQF
jgi:hypothetical protein